MRAQRERTFIVAAAVVIAAGGGALRRGLPQERRPACRAASSAAPRPRSTVDVGAGRITVPASSVRAHRGGALGRSTSTRSAPAASPPRTRTRGSPSGSGPPPRGSRHAGARGLQPRAQRAAPDDPRANAALGNVQVDGRWVSEDEGYRAQGYVQFEGEWITPAEHEAILRERAAEAEQERQRQEGEQRAREAEARAQEAEARARQAEAEAQEAQAASEGHPALVRLGSGPRRPGRPDRSSLALPDGCRGERRECASLPRRGGAPRARGASPAQTVDEIVAKHVAARGGREALAAVRDPAHDGPGQRRPRTGGDRAARDRAPRPHPHRVRVPGDDGRLRLGRIERLAACRPSTAASSRSRCRRRPPPCQRRAGRLRGPARRLEGQGPQGRRSWAARRCPAAPAHELEGHAEVGRRPPRLGRRGLPASWCGRSRRGRSAGTTRRSRSVYGDYRETGGVRFPHAIETGARDRPQRLQIVVETVEINPALDGSRFAAPALLQNAKP